MAVVFFVPYLAIQHWQGVPVRTLPETWVDRWVPFESSWVYAYLSIYLLVPLVPWLLSRAGDVSRYLLGFAGMCVTCYAAFLLFPVHVPRPGAEATTAAYRWVTSLDGPSNAFPSLHAGLALYALLAGRRILPADAPPWGRMAYVATALAWSAAIFYSTLATRQHGAWDLVAGAALAIACEAIASRRARVT